MRVLFLVGEVKNGLGMSPFIYSQGESLKKAGVEVDYLILRGYSFSKYIFGIFKLKKYLKAVKYDLIHAHYSYCGFTATFQNDVPVVLSFMGSDILEKFGIFRSFLENKVKSRIFRKVNNFICKSEEIKRSLPLNFNSVVIPNGVDFKIFYPVEKDLARKQLGLSSDKKYVLFASNPDRKEKNYKLAKESVSVMNDSDIILLTVFDKSQDILNLYYNASDVLILTSDYEGSPNIVKEALACNLPIVSLDVGDVRKQIYNVDSCYVMDNNKSLIHFLNIVLNTNKRSNGREKRIGINIQDIAIRIRVFYKSILCVLD